MKMTHTSGLSLAWARTTAISMGIVVSATASGQTFDPPELTPLELLGKHVFFDTDLAKPKKQGCVSCHDPAAGWTFPDSVINEGQVVAPGAIWHRSGGIKTPGNSYASFAPVFQPCLDAFGGNRGAPRGGRYCGGMFWDGRAEGYGKLEGIPFGDQGTVSATITPDDLPQAVRAAYSEFLGPVADQALNPFPNSVEQNIDPEIVCKRVGRSDYSHLYLQAFGEPINCKTKPKSNSAYLTSFKRLAVALSAYQASADVNSFTSPRDIALRKELACLPGGDLGEFEAFYDSDFCNQVKPDGTPWGEFPLLELSDLENQGHDLFYGLETASNAPEPLLDEEGLPVLDENENPVLTTINAGCHRCHNDNPNVDDGTEPFQTYNDFAYHGIGIPFNREIPGVVPGQINGSFSHVSVRADTGGPVVAGFFKNPTARNVAKGEGEITKAYGHNGYFKSLEGIVHFYSSRDLKPDCADSLPEIEHPTEAEALSAPTGWVDAGGAARGGCWPQPEFANPGNFAGVGILNLTQEQEDSLVAYLKALADQYTPTAP